MLRILRECVVVCILRGSGTRNNARRSSVSASSVSRRAALRAGVALGAVCALGLLPADGGAEAAEVETRPAAEGAAVARRLGLSAHGVLRARGGPDVVYGELGGLTVAVAGAGVDEVVIGVDGGVDAPRVYAVSAAGA